MNTLDLSRPEYTYDALVVQVGRVKASGWLPFGACKQSGQQHTQTIYVTARPKPGRYASTKECIHKRMKLNKGNGSIRYRHTV